MGRFGNAIKLTALLAVMGLCVGLRSSEPHSCSVVVGNKKEVAGMVCPEGTVAVGVASLRPAKVYCAVLTVTCETF